MIGHFVYEGMEIAYTWTDAIPGNREHPEEPEEITFDMYSPSGDEITTGIVALANAAGCFDALEAEVIKEIRQHRREEERVV